MKNGRLRNDTRDTRRKQAERRQEAHDKLTPQQKIQKLDDKFGAGQGAKKERARLTKQIEEAGGGK